ncbi:MAG: hypothetical protein K0S76_1490 [Herbinix sp.]|jgi:hypothetical protein|nr:hypothetical protein [Herbinix sp.]
MFADDGIVRAPKERRGAATANFIMDLISVLDLEQLWGKRWHQ